MTDNPPPWTDGLRGIDFARISELLGRRLHHEALSGELAMLRESVVSAIVVVGLAEFSVPQICRRPKPVRAMRPFESPAPLNSGSIVGALNWRVHDPAIRDVPPRVA